jgi:nicotinate-nucleotide adenylyltransferase
VETIAGRKLGIFGGTFDPLHNGHLQLAKVAIRELKLHQVIFVPCGSPPHKSHSGISAFSHRLAMIELATKNSALLSSSSIESTLKAPTYTIDMLKSIRQMYHEQEKFFFLVGSDAFLDIASWKNYYRLLAEITFVLVMRTGDRIYEVEKFLNKLGFAKKGRKWRLVDAPEAQLILLSEQIDDISATDIRQKVRNNQTIDNLVPPEIREYIAAHKLYTADSPPQ